MEAEVAKINRVIKETTGKGFSKLIIVGHKQGLYFVRFGKETSLSPDLHGVYAHILFLYHKWLRTNLT